jgi:hypothetical protein
MSKAKVVLILDDSASMMNGMEYGSWARLNSKAFINMLLEWDKLAIVKFSKLAEDAFADTDGTLAEIKIDSDGSSKQLLAADNSIDLFTFKGGNTNTGSAIKRARAKLPNECGVNQALILFPDGRSNIGTKPECEALNMKYPIYTSALGRGVHEVELMAIADASPPGKYKDSTSPARMMEILNEIRGQDDNCQSIYNAHKTHGKYDFELNGVDILPNLRHAQFSAVWTTELKFTESTTPASDQISIILYDPNFKIISPERVGDGFAIFNIANPMGGKWQLQSMTGNTDADTSVTVGSFEFERYSGDTPHLCLKAHYQSDQKVIRIAGNLTDSKHGVSNVTISTEVIHPGLSLQDSLARNSELIEKVELNMEQSVDGLMDGETQTMLKFNLLNTQTSPATNLLKMRRTPLLLKRAPNGDIDGMFEVPDICGSYLIKVSLVGVLKSTRAPFSRTGLVNVYVP